ncbi:tubulin polyglutamylase TTLL13-like, partial [Octopus sinensis]|uniref:Tubulin polyglutamylase TTLL13-like n=1 Tax=Octopus sinensis TaxID=2607531 RepID=A0A7E6EKA0_9MOLL
YSQKINHFSGMVEICRKDFLNRNLMKMRKLFPKEYNFFPKTWNLSAELSPFVTCCSYGDLQMYMSPLLIDGFKFDLRLYVLITFCDPLRIFLYNDGLARFCTEKYSEPTIKNMACCALYVNNVNLSPSFHTDHPIDVKIKESLLLETYSLISIGSFKKKKPNLEEKRRMQERLTNNDVFKINKYSAFKQFFRDELLRKQEEFQLKLQVMENRRLNNFVRIYPKECDQAKYDKFFDSIGSLYKETAAYRARLSCAKWIFSVKFLDKCERNWSTRKTKCTEKQKSRPSLNQTCQNVRKVFCIQSKNRKKYNQNELNLSLIKSNSFLKISCPIMVV